MTITPIEYVWASYAGVLRQQQNIIKQRTDAYGCVSGYDPHVTGALGEFVVSLALNAAWRGPGIFRGDDVVGYQVRATERANGSLILHEADDDDARFVPVTGGPLEWRIPGWCYGRDGKQQKFWRDFGNGRPAYFVPQSALRPIDALSIEVQRQMAFQG